MTNLRGRNIVLGVCGSIAAYKAADLASRLVKLEATVEALMTASAAKFITPLSLQSLTGRPVIGDMYDAGSETAEAHVAIARRADAIVIAPASASMLARLAHGFADDIIGLTVLASRAPVLIAPAMDNQMFEAAITQENVRTLRERGYAFVGPESGRLASGHTGTGRLSEPATIVEALRFLLGRRGDLVGRKVVVTAGGTREAIDPVRYIGNHSSGKMGYALAEAARDRGADVVLVSAPASLSVPYGVRRVAVQSTLQMRDAVVAETRECDALVMAAAPADFRVAEEAAQKIKRHGGEGLTLDLVENPDIIGGVSGDFVKVGFAAESQDLVENARAKIGTKGLDFIVANDITAGDAGFDADTNRVVIIDGEGPPRHLTLLPKYEVAQRILDRVAQLLEARDAASPAAQAAGAP
ncbi:MAG: bifunctional phosphopantothenoylcysteine decarboxylase/phosphopantothenate--cysteine ligase CoaBC [Dehalococcoidia bacterium]